ncbi:MAG: EscU/YscU/HrcU family type III secretion system export apparatus switch protein [Deltaproteobacteria bacterium]|nr:EscU/YscU/HrcU family type III secretion system export apparatus switch protein [Deltaproteobacteria bacterium]
MADGGTGEKTEEPTPERLRKLRKEGNVPKSQDINHAVSFIVVLAVLAGSMPWMGGEIIGLVKSAFLGAETVEARGQGVLAQLLLQSLITMLKVCAPTLGAAAVLGVVLNVSQVGFMFTMKPIMPDLNKVNPINGFKNLLNKKKLVELLKTILKFVVIGYLSYAALKDAMRDVVLMMRSDLYVGMSVIGKIIWHFTIRIGGVFVLIAAADAFYQRRRYLKDNMMSKYDVKQEYKQSEGDPHHKAERRRFHQEILSSAAPAAVKKADVVVRNPEHIAIALKYDKEKGSDAAPTVIAKGTRLWAEKILEAAREAGVPVVRNVPLAQALNKLEVGDEIPEDLYEAVAEVLNFVFKLSEEQKKKATGGRLPARGQTAPPTPQAPSGPAAKKR